MSDVAADSCLTFLIYDRPVASPWRSVAVNSGRAWQALTHGSPTDHDGRFGSASRRARRLCETVIPQRRSSARTAS